MKLKTPILDCVLNYHAKTPTRFHTPGHQGVFKGGIFKGSGYDITELSFSDNLLYTSGIIKESEEQAAEFYGSCGTLYFTNGATSAVFAAVSAVAGYGKNIVIGRNCHKSVLAAASSNGLKPFFFDMEDDGEGYLYPAKAAAVEKALKKIPDVAAVVITSPDYFGRCAETGDIYKVVKEYGTRLITDQAHGAHFVYSGLLPLSAVGRSDYVIDSCHKTMPVYSGGAILHCSSDKFRLEAELKRAAFHTTSPQYLTLASIDYAIARMADDGGSVYAGLYSKLHDFVRAIENTDFCYVNNENHNTSDFSRLVLNCGEYSGEQLSQELEKRNIYAEMSYGNRAVFILSPYNPNALDKLAAAIKDIKLTEKAKEIHFPPACDTTESTLFLSGRQIEFIDIEEAEGRISAVEIGIYPPGTPAVVRGSAVTREALDYFLKNKGKLFGLIEGKVAVRVEN
ncbi:MAG: aminotransferase class I/II-fold pyridoxal phosphate-dependent enzyme [Clostridiales bacterium]|jgi:arginine/lysine/ornithine decarboxylase|nr:aminotransferase class I/II-fold pyridoxal phosphate-dependent enzyme [Clostridiales bacterium]